MTIAEYHARFDFISDKEQSGYLAPEEKDRCIDLGQMDIVNKLKQIYGEGVDSHEAMAPFVTTYSFELVDTDDGYLEIPEDQNFMRLSALTIRTFDGDKAISGTATIVNHDALAKRLKSQLNAVTVDNPIITVEGIGKWNIYPVKDNAMGVAGEVKFLRRPKVPFYKYTIVGEEIVHDAAGSVDPEWGEMYTGWVLYRALVHAGFKLSDTTLAEAGITMVKLEPGS